MPNIPPLELPPLEWLRAFESAGRLANFTQAAAEIGLTQAAVSQRITALEKALGKPLFRRLHRGVELTADGEAYLPHVERAFAEIRRGTADLFGAPRKRITIAAPASASSLWIAPRLAGFSARHAGLEISLASIHREIDYAAVQSDYQVRFGNGAWPGYDAALLYLEALAPACAPALLTSGMENWHDLPRIAVNGAREGWFDWSRATNAPVSNAPLLRFDSFIAGLHACLAGAGVILASLPLVRTHLSAGTLQLLAATSHDMAAGHWLIWPARSHKPAHTEILLAELRREID